MVLLDRRTKQRRVGESMKWKRRALPQAWCVEGINFNSHFPTLIRLHSDAMMMMMMMQLNNQWPCDSLPINENIGRYIAITIDPIVTPKNPINAGSIRVKRLAMAASTSCS